MKKVFAFLLVFGLALGLAQPQPTVTMFEFLSLNEGFSTLTTALQETGLDATLQGAGTFTLFAPTDAAFAALPEGRRNALLGNPNALKAFLNELIVPERLTAGDLLERGRVETAAGSDLGISAGSDGTLSVDGVAVVGADVGVNGGIQVGNGVIQVIDELPASLR